VKQFSGRKSVILSTTSILGGKNEFLGIAYMVVGCICFVLGVLFLFVHVRYGKEFTDNIRDAYFLSRENERSILVPPTISRGGRRDQ